MADIRTVAAVQASPATSPRERPIIFSGPMVAAIHADRKTQTRRLVKAPKWSQPFRAGVDFRCPYGQPGDRLWVRETFAIDHPAHPQARQSYRADLTSWGRCGDGEGNWLRICPEKLFPRGAGRKVVRWTPAIHMPRWASRLTLEVIDVRVQRLEEITPEDVVAEGLRPVTKDGHTVKYGVPDLDGWPGGCDVGWEWTDWNVDPLKAYARLWDAINGKRAPWASNPWVWAVTFRRLP